MCLHMYYMACEHAVRNLLVFLPMLNIGCGAWDGECKGGGRLQCNFVSAATPSGLRSERVNNIV